MNSQGIQPTCLLNAFSIKPQRGSLAKAENQKGPGEIFLRFMDGTLGSAKKTFSCKARQGMTRANNGHQGATGDETQHCWIGVFRTRLLSAGIPLEDLSLSGKVLPRLKKLLLAEGFSEGRVNYFLERLFNGGGEDTIKIPELLEKLSELKTWSDKKSKGPILKISVIPYLETLLRSFGLELQEVKNVISESRIEGGSLSLKSLIQNLKGITEKLPNDTKLVVSQQSTEDIKAMLTRMGLVDEAGKIDGPISLERFVRILKEKVANTIPHSLSKGAMENQVDALLANMSVVSEERGLKSTLERHYANKLKRFAHDGLKHNRTPKEIIEGLEEAVSQTKKTGIGTEATSKFQAKTGDLFLKMDKVVEVFRRQPPEKMFDPQDSAATQCAKGAVAGRASFSQSVIQEAPRLIPLHLVDQVGRQLGLALKRGDSQVRIQLKPPELGSIQLDMTMKDNILKVFMIAEHHSVKELLMSHVHELKQALVERGVELQGMDVEIDYNFSQSMANAQKDANGTKTWMQGLASASGVPESGVEDTGVIARNLQSDSLLDMFV